MAAARHAQVIHEVSRSASLVRVVGVLLAPLLVGCPNSRASQGTTVATSAPVSSTSTPVSSTPPSGSSTPAEPPAPLPGKVLSIEAFQQEHDNWCWAASLQTITASIGGGTGIKQCRQADDKGKNGGGTAPSCCSPGMPASCDGRDWPDFPRYGYRVTKTNNCWLSWAQLTDQIDHGKPFAFTIRVLDSTGRLQTVHMYVALGYQVLEDGSRNVYVADSTKLADPSLPASKMWFDYDLYYKESNGWQHSDDFYEIAADTAAVNPPAAGNSPPCPND